MKIKNKNLEWNVLLFDWNKKNVVNYNIFSYRLIELINKKLSDNEINNIDDLKEVILSWARRKYWARAEYEIMVGDIIAKDLKKVDVFRQIEMNINRIVEYINKELGLF